MFFPHLAAGARFSRAWQRVHVFTALGRRACFSPTWQRVQGFSAFGSGCKFFPRLAAVASLFRAWQQVHVFPALGSGCKFVPPGACFPALDIPLTTDICFPAFQINLRAVQVHVDVFPSRLSHRVCFRIGGFEKIVY